MTVLSELPETQYATVGDLSIAYQVLGKGSMDFIVVPGVISHVEYFHNLHGYTDFLREISSLGRVITFDKRGQGLSERISGAPSMEERMDDITTVMGATGSERAAFVTISEGGALSLLFAATYPEKVSHLFICGGYAKGHGTEDYPFRQGLEERLAKVELWRSNWGKGIALDFVAPSLLKISGMREVFGQAERLSCTPTGMKQFFVLNIQSDIRAALDLVKAPTIIFHARGDRQVPYEAGQHLAENIEHARLVTIEGDDHIIWAGDFSLFVEEIKKACVGETQSYSVSSRVLATVLFTDIVDSTGQLANMGDENWRNLLDKHDDFASGLVERFQGELVKSTGDGLLAIFDGPGRAIQCAQALVEQMNPLGISIRAAMHTGEIERRKDDISGLAVHVAARILGLAGSGEVLMSKLVTDLVAGSSKFSFESLGTHELKGLSGGFDIFKGLSTRVTN
ncbi:adenylate/guanylate cyclase domain-containing protein [Gammaproteobacteria bacterium]|nr:adenylate/guanylate cyclase domain-containing protein [Gammaproteobacteria bacterium]